MPNESSGQDLQIILGHFYIISLLHGVICVTKCQRPSNCFFLFFFFSWPLFSQRLGYLTKQLAITFQQNFTYILMGSVRIAVQNIIDPTDDLDLSRSQLYKITLWAISRFLLAKLSPKFSAE